MDFLLKQCFAFFNRIILYKIWLLNTVLLNHVMPSLNDHILNEKELSEQC